MQNHNGKNQGALASFQDSENASPPPSMSRAAIAKMTQESFDHRVPFVNQTAIANTSTHLPEHFFELTGQKKLHRKVFWEFIHLVGEKLCEPEHGTLWYIDLNGFSHINHEWGYAVGDDLITLIEYRLNAVIQAFDQDWLYCTYGAGRWLVFSAHFITQTQAQRHYHKLVTILAEPISPSTELVPDTFVPNFRMVCASKQSNEAQCPSITFEYLLTVAEQSMGMLRKYDGCFSYATKPSAAPFRDTNTMKKALNTAKQQNRLQLFLQPKVDLTSGDITGVECLFRWLRRTQKDNHKEAWYPTDKIIACADKLCVLEDLGLWTIDELYRVAQQLYREDQPMLFLALNLSPKQLQSSAIIERLVINGNTWPELRRYVTIEVTEDSVTSNRSMAYSNARTLSEQGYALAIDDFGVGHSNLQSLLSMKVDSIKIDKSLIFGLGFSRVSTPQQAVIKAVSQAAAELGIYIVAEGIEYPDQIGMLQSLGIDIGQGYLLGKPMPIDEFLLQYSHGLKVDLSTLTQAR